MNYLFTIVLVADKEFTAHIDIPTDDTFTILELKNLSKSRLFPELLKGYSIDEFAFKNLQGYDYCDQDRLKSIAECNISQLLVYFPKQDPVKRNCPNSQSTADRIRNMELTLPWVVYERGSIKDWLNRHRPSVVSQSDVAWISIHNKNYDYTRANSDLDYTCFENFKEEIKRFKTEDEKIEYIDSLAKKSGLISGKWLLFVPPAKIDRIWKNIAYDTRNGELGTSAKVSPTNGTPHCICIFTKDCFDTKDVERVRLQLKNRHSIQNPIIYKMDIYTELGIYSRNPWKLIPFRYKY
ncbi:hypothetical protein HK103_004507 [Boothiomyces macroporosus]|uniref:Uncharacterized protein n=1 Tax=Boothiomyces macroporosus TaxID=261099 RepID=A0AAD5Y3Z3_9FUNG|nr:hypothetical protein HK103_004507 [Boothiomyces macroporosus]